MPVMAWYPCGCCRYCDNCASNFAPIEWQVDISGVVNSTPPNCASCADLNGAYVAVPAGNLPFGTCLWEYVLPSPICGVTKVRLAVGMYWMMPPVYSIAVQLFDAAGNLLMFTQKTYAARPDCTGMAAESLGPLNLTLGPVTCDASASAVAITALRPCEP
jgi:hypothetical protein